MSEEEKQQEMKKKKKCRNSLIFQIEKTEYNQPIQNKQY